MLLADLKHILRTDNQRMVFLHNPNIGSLVNLRKELMAKPRNVLLSNLRKGLIGNLEDVLTVNPRNSWATVQMYNQPEDCAECTHGQQEECAYTGTAEHLEECARGCRKQSSWAP